LLREAYDKMMRQGLLDSTDAGKALEVLAERFLTSAERSGFGCTKEL